MTTYAAVIGVTRDVLAGDYCDVSVAETIITTYREDDDGNEIPVRELSDNVVMEAVETTVRADDIDPWSRLENEAEEILAGNGWQVTGKWEQTDNAAYAPVERV